MPNIAEEIEKQSKIFCVENVYTVQCDTQPYRDAFFQEEQGVSLLQFVDSYFSQTHLCIMHIVCHYYILYIIIEWDRTYFVFVPSCVVVNILLNIAIKALGIWQTDFNEDFFSVCCFTAYYFACCFPLIFRIQTEEWQWNHFFGSPTSPPNKKKIKIQFWFFNHLKGSISFWDETLSHLKASNYCFWLPFRKKTFVTCVPINEIIWI